VGLTKPDVAMFHLTTHAFFKALLFLGAGAVIYALHHEQDIWKMGGLRRRIPITWVTFLLATLALCGVPPFSGFYSKDAILAAAHHGKMPLFILGVVVAGLTSFYMFRLLFVVFMGPEKGEKSAHAHEPPKVMWMPLVFLAILAVAGGFMGISDFLDRMKPLAEARHVQSFMAVLVEPFRHDFLAAVLGLLATGLGFVAAWVLYGKATKDPLPAMLGPVAHLLRDKFYLDDIYQGVIGLTHEALAKVAAWMDVWIISGLGVRGTHGATELAGRALRLFQTGNLQTYAFLFVSGVAVVLWRMLR
jgi:NADH-quinone oxidoreductase subunit L